MSEKTLLILTFFSWTFGFSTTNSLSILAWIVHLEILSNCICPPLFIVSIHKTLLLTIKNMFIKLLILHNNPLGFIMQCQKNPVCRRHWISRPMRMEAGISFIYLFIFFGGQTTKKICRVFQKKNLGRIHFFLKVNILILESPKFLFWRESKIFLGVGRKYIYFSFSFLAVNIFFSRLKNIFFFGDGQNKLFLRGGGAILFFYFFQKRK